MQAELGTLYFVSHANITPSRGRFPVSVKRASTCVYADTHKSVGRADGCVRAQSCLV